jgi:hypothetical protein
VQDSGGTVRVDYLGNDAHVHELHLSPGQHWAHYDLSAGTHAPPAK